ncbi:hypothetical protein OAT71_02110 [Flavobacteriales bacterium]|nr:hypothetical protein [Flavobacteriales bacterium]
MRENICPFLIVSLTLGLAPFTPEPHILRKIKWVMEGGNGKQTMDMFVLLLHGIPWILLFLASNLKMTCKKSN